MLSFTALALQAVAVVTLFLIAGSHLMAGNHQATADNAPNILIVMVDDMGFSDIGCFGGEVDTPTLDRLAHEGIRFSRIYNNAKCHASRVSLLSGLYIHR